MEKKKFSIKKVSFPKQSESDAVKKTLEYGKAVGEAIQGEWFHRASGNSRYYNFKNEIQRRRLYARGEQDISKYKHEMAVNGDLSYLNLNWTPVPIIPKFVDIVVNGMQGRAFDIKASAIDPTSTAEQQGFRNIIRRDMIAKDILMEAQEVAGINAFNVDPSVLPENDEELDIFMELGYKPKVEMAVELSVSSIFKDNDYQDVIKKKLDTDNVEIGISVVKHEFDKNTGVKLHYVNPEDFVWSYTDDPYFRDCYYFGEVKRVNVSEVHRMFPNLTKEQLERISNSGSYWDIYNSISGNTINQEYEGIPDSKATLLFFNYKTTQNQVYKKKKTKSGGSKIIKKDDTFNPPKDVNQDFEKISWVEEVWYDGIMVLGCNEILKWEKSLNQVRPKTKEGSNVVYPSYFPIAPKLYNGNIESLVSRMIPFADLIQLVHLKLQQVLMKVIPDGAFIDIDGVNEIDLGNGQSYNATEALNMYLQTGSVIGKGVTAEGEFNHGRVPIQELTSNGGGQKIQSLILSYNHYLQMIRDVTGLNEARDGSTPDKFSLVGLQKMAAYNSNTATRHVLDAGTYVTKKLAEAIVLRLSDALENSTSKDDLISRLGVKNLEILEQMKHIPLRDFAIYIELAPDEEQTERLEANIQQEMANGTLWIEDAIDIRLIGNIKLANQVLKLKKKKRIEQLQAQEKEKIEQQTQSNIDSAQAAAQSKAELSQIEAQSKVLINDSLINAEIRKLQEEAAIKEKLMAIEFEYKKQLLEMQMGVISDKDKYKEDRKDKRLAKQSTHQSKLIAQRKNEDEPVDFEQQEEQSELFDSNGEFASLPKKPALSGLKTFESAGMDTIGSGFDLETYNPK